MKYRSECALVLCVILVTIALVTPLYEALSNAKLLNSQIAQSNELNDFLVSQDKFFSKINEARAAAYQSILFNKRRDIERYKTAAQEAQTLLDTFVPKAPYEASSDREFLYNLKDEFHHIRQTFDRAIYRRSRLGLTEGAQMLLDRQFQSGLLQFDGTLSRAKTIALTQFNQERHLLESVAKQTVDRFMVAGTLILAFLIAMVLFVAYDISKKRRMAVDLATANVRAAAASQAKSDFLANMSHEIRTPMNGIIGMVQIMEDTPLQTTQKDHLNIIKSSARSLLKIINDILDLSKIESGKMTVESIDVDLEHVCRGAIHILEPQALDKGLALNLEIDENVPNVIKSDPVRLRQVLINLMGNSIKFTDTGSVSLNIGVVKQTGTKLLLHFSVRDTGVGMEEEHLSRVFNKFQQGDTSTARKYGGTGLGLNISDQIVTLLGGKLKVKSKPQEGTTFHFKLLTQVGDSIAVANEDFFSNAPSPPREGHDFSILVAEDDPVNQLVTSRFLKKLGYSIRIAENGREVLKAMEQDHFSLILMDCQMPEMDGYETTKIIRQRNKARRIPIIALTANAFKEDVVRCKDAGMDDFLTKPMDIRDLEIMLEKWILAPAIGAKRNETIA